MPTSAAGHYSKALARTIQRCAARGLTQKAEALLRALVADDQAAEYDRQGRTAKTVRSIKKKGREGVLAARAWILQQFPDLEEDDLIVQTTSVGGSDIVFSPAACRAFPFAPESKKVESLNVWKALHQAEANAKKKGRAPVLFFSRSHGDLYIAFKASDLSAWIADMGREPETRAVEFCDGCDGVGWYEGGETLKTSCKKCGGTGEMPRVKKSR